jgi:hypothetical protein
MEKEENELKVRKKKNKGKKERSGTKDEDTKEIIYYLFTTYTFQYYRYVK